ncbi:glycosyltransferase family 4 protein [filamentous cyanobacterium LEGE 11480]|uniref:Glycosyltransferase family 4 protein n=2 Tax=Romeriopsis TaxID=2992131 RepID=A0A928Z4U6_9CYAN|nr:glycosyltransferase family 4 protein [Romeriopsis navalis LEGE 11480]
MCQGLASAGHSVSLMHGNFGDLVDRYSSFCQQIFSVPSLALSRKTLLKSLLNLLPDLFKIRHQIATTDSPLLYCNQIYDIPLPALLATLTGTPFACHLRLPPPQNLNPIYQQAIQRVDRFFTVSEHTRQQWIDFGISPAKIVTIHNGTNPDKFAPDDPAKRELLRQKFLQTWNIPSSAKILAYTGRLDRRKGIEVLLPAIAQLRERFPDLHLLIAGKALLDGPQYQAKLEQQTIDLGISDIVHFLGHISNPSQLYAASHLTVIPSLWPEPFGKVVIESMACGTPVVASRTGGIPEILTGEFAMGLCEPKNADRLAETIAQLMDWPTTHPELGQRSRHHVLQNFTLATAIQRLETELDHTLQRRVTDYTVPHSAVANYKS